MNFIVSPVDSKTNAQLDSFKSYLIASNKMNKRIPKQQKLVLSKHADIDFNQAISKSSLNHFEDQMNPCKIY